MNFPPPPPPEKSPQQTQLVPKPPQQLQVVQKAPPPPPPQPPPPEKSPQQTQLVPKPPQQLQVVQKTPPPPPPDKSPQQKPPLPGAGNTALVPPKSLTETGSKSSNTGSKQMSALTVPQKQPQKQQQNQKSSNTGSKGSSSGGKFSGTRSYTSFTSVSSRTVESYSKTTTKTAVNITKWSSGNRNAVDEAEEDPAQDPESANNGPNDGAWLFEQVSPVSGEELMKFSVAAILMFNKAGIVVYASRLGPDTDLAAYRSILLELNALSMKKA